MNNKSIIANASLFAILAITLVAVIITKYPHKTTHPIGTSHDSVVHVHGDFQMYIGDNRIRFTDEKYQSSTAHTHHASLHFHDGNDEVIHRHANNVTFSEFFDSIGMTLTNDCLTMDTGVKHCTVDNNKLLLLVNGKPVPDIRSYIFAEEDRILLYYGNQSNPKLSEYIENVTDIACMYSGTCPERGTPPTESCGLTCEVADLAATDSKGLWHQVKELFVGE